LYKEAKLDIFLDTPYGIAAKSYDATGHRDKTEKYAIMAIDVRSAFNGIVIESDEKIRELRMLME
jgi:hypothetical protein